MNKIWFYLGLILVCTGVGTGLGVVLLILYFWSDIKSTFADYELIFQKKSDIFANFYDDETLNKMK